MYAEELITQIRQKLPYKGASLNDSGAWKAAVQACCEVIEEVMEHTPKVEDPIVEVPIKKFGKKKDD